MINSFWCLFLGCCYLLSSAINPFLYSIFSKRFRRGFYDLINGCCKRQEKEGKRPLNNIPKASKHRNQVVNRQAMLRHFDIGSSRPDGYVTVLDARKVLFHKEKSTPKRRSSLHATLRNEVMTSTACSLYSEPILKVAESRYYRAKNGKAYKNIVPLSKQTNLSATMPPAINIENEYHECKRLTCSNETDHYKYKVIFNGSSNVRI